SKITDILAKLGKVLAHV
uniref:Bombolitin-2 n=2 Tax=Bombus TaxID=28641 RepID=BOL2_BOMPE|nr:RecName: Full=Bombolitin-2; AltName: Full=Bombolitin II [Bombus pensylvanicus]